LILFSRRSVLASRLTSGYQRNKDDVGIFSVVSNVFLFVPSVSNPIIYIMSNPGYRRAYRALLCPKKKGGQGQSEFGLHQIN
jgi:hypothetical protein